MNTWLWIGTAGMTLGAFMFLILGRRASGEGRSLVLITFFIALIAATAYLAMALDLGTTDVGGREVLYARYIDWILTTPLLLLDLAILVRAGWHLTAWLIGLDLHMITTGLIAGLTPGDERYIWFTVSCASFAGILWILLKQFRVMASERGEDARRLFLRLGALTGVLWSIYPVVWILGTEGTGAVSLTTEVAMFTVLDLMAKVGFGLLLLTNRAAMERVSASPGPGLTAREAVPT